MGGMKALVFHEMGEYTSSVNAVFLVPDDFDQHEDQRQFMTKLVEDGMTAGNWGNPKDTTEAERLYMESLKERFGETEVDSVEATMGIV